MNAGLNRVSAMVATLLKWARAERGNIAPLLAIMAIPIVGAFSIATETGSWWTLQRSQQNAADSAVIAAGIRGATSEGDTIATNYGYTNSTNNVTVTWAAVSSSTCPATATKVLSGSNCYQVTITRKVPLYLTQVVGFREGTTVIGTTPAKTIAATAIAGTISSTSAYCIGAKQDIVFNGGGSSGANAFQGCSMIAGGSMTCNGNNAAGGVLYGASPNNKGCGAPATAPSYADPYASRVTSAISKMSSCGSTQAGGTITSISQGSLNCFSGQVTIPAAGLTVTQPNTILKISNGGLNLAGPLSTSGSGSLTIVITGAQTAGSVMSFSGGSLNIASPTSGDWNNIAIAVDPNLAAGDHCKSDASGKAKCDLDIASAGNTIIDLTGLIYDPNGTVQLSGAISKASSSTDICILIWAAYLNGNGNESYGVPAPGKDCYARDNTVPTVSVVALLK